MRSADSIGQLLQKSYDTLPLSQSAAGSIKLAEFADLLLPVISIAPTPERDRIIAVQSLDQTVIIGGGNVGISFFSDSPDPGQIHRYVRIAAVNEDSSCTIDLIVRSTVPGPLNIDHQISRIQGTQPGVELPINAGRGPGPDSVGTYSSLPTFFDVYPGGSVQIRFSLVAATETVRIQLQRLVLHGPRQALDEPIPSFTFVQV